MKTNKLKVFFIICFISLLVALTAKSNPIINASAVSPPQEVFAPKLPPSEYNFQMYNHCGGIENDLLLCYYQAKYSSIIYSNSKGTFVSYFDKDLYKVKETKFLDNICVDGIVKDGYIYLIDSEQLFIFDFNLNTVDKKSFDNIKAIKVIDDIIYLFCNGEIKKQKFEYGFVININYDFINKQDNYFIFQNKQELLITDFDKNLIFETDNFLSAKKFNDKLFFATTKDTVTIITCLFNFEIDYTTTLPITSKYVSYEFDNKGLTIYACNSKTYKYFICNHGDIISNEIFSDNIYIDVINNIYENNSYIFITINSANYKINKAIYTEKHYICDNIIIFELYKNLETYGGKDVYIAIV